MECIPRPPVNKIPGGGMPLAQRDVHIKDLTKLTLLELLDIKERESKLLANKSKLNRLPDKGQRIQDFYDKVIRELQRRSNIEEAAAMFSELNIADKGKEAIDQLEWDGQVNGSSLDPTADVLDSDDEADMDPLRLIAQRKMHERKVKVIPPEESLITPRDLEDIKTFKAHSSDSEMTQDVAENPEEVDSDIVTFDVTDKMKNLKPKLQKIMESTKKRSHSSEISSNSNHSGDRLELNDTPVVEQHVQYLVDMVEADRQPQREKFKPYQTTVSNVHDPEKEKLRKRGKHWEVTAATPPPIQHNGVKMLSLLDSVELQSSYMAKLKEIQEKQAAERLAAKIERFKNRKMHLPSEEVLQSSASFTTYRNPAANLIEGEQICNERDEVHDLLDEDKPGGVNYEVFE